MTDKDKKDKSIDTDPRSGDEILKIIRQGTEFTHELLEENEKLRFRVAELESVGSGEISDDKLKSALEDLKGKVDELASEKAQLVKKYEKVENENIDFAKRYIEIENQNNVMANLYVASYQLHSTLDFNEVLRIILEIVINLVGAEKFTMMLVDEETHNLQSVASEGMENEDMPEVSVGEGVIGMSAKKGEEYFKADMSDVTAESDLLDPLVCIPMKIKDRIIGCLVIHKLFQQKTEFTTLDYELFTLLAGHTATAIFSSKLYSHSERKLNTMQGFIDLMSK